MFKFLLNSLYIIVTVIILSGCNLNSESNIDLSGYPESVQNGTVSVEFYDEMLKFISLFDNIYDGFEAIYESELEYPNINHENSFLDAVQSLQKESSSILSDLNLNSKTGADKEWNKRVDALVAIQKLYGDATLQKAIEEHSFEETQLHIDRAMIQNMYGSLRSDFLELE